MYDNCAESDCVLHELHLDAMGSSEYVEKFFLFLVVLDFVVEFDVESVDASGGAEADLNIMLLSWVDGDGRTRDDGDKLFL